MLFNPGYLKTIIVLQVVTCIYVFNQLNDKGGVGRHRRTITNTGGINKSANHKNEDSSNEGNVSEESFCVKSFYIYLTSIS